MFSAETHRQIGSVGVLESLRGLLWARRRSPDQVRYFLSLAHERFQPDDLVVQAAAAERAGFDAVCCSDHLDPWWAPDAPTPAGCGNAWVWLGAAGQATRRVSLGTAVTGLLHRYNPVVLAQQVATLERLFPGRAFVGAGSSAGRLADGVWTLGDPRQAAPVIVSADTDTHVKRLRMLERLGATTVCVMNCSGVDPLGTIRVYGERVLPELRA